ncbi:MAG: hypothetical protein HY934_09060 [Candidatus Firestonebacteria bacterium]|nr:hypothetical protein [Candidatus Firestonebacteria bacterium]
MNKIKILILILFLTIINSLTYANPIVTPYYHFSPAGQLQTGLKEIYTHEKDSETEDIMWSSDTKLELNSSIFKDFELEISFPYTSKNSTRVLDKQQGLNDSKIYFRYHIYSNQNYILSDRDLDVALQFGGKIYTGEKKKGLIDRENEILTSLLGTYELGKYLDGECFLYFHMGLWLPLLEDYTYDNVFQYDFALEYKANDKMSFLLEGNGFKNPDNNRGYIAPGFQFHPDKNLELNLSIGGNLPILGESINTRTIVGVNYIF